jgi:hypothetical protein
VPLPREVEHVLKASFHDRLETLVDEIFGPEVSTAILHPLEI